MTRSDPSPSAQDGEFERLVRKHQNRLFAIAYRILRERERAADMVQEAFVRIYRNFEKLDPERSFSAWSSRIVVNLCLNELRARKRWSYLEEEGDEPSCSDEEIELGELRALVRETSAQLSPHRQTLLALSVMGYSYEEMADCLEWKVSQVKSELFRARQKLRGLLQGKVV